jgi:hypothetical protein
LSAEIIFYAFDVIFAEISSGLDFNKDHIGFSNIMDAMQNSSANINCRSSPKTSDVAIDRNFSITRDDEPVFCALLMALV